MDKVLGLIDSYFWRQPNKVKYFREGLEPEKSRNSLRHPAPGSSHYCASSPPRIKIKEAAMLVNIVTVIVQDPPWKLTGNTTPYRHRQSGAPEGHSILLLSSVSSLVPFRPFLSQVFGQYSEFEQMSSS